MDRLKRQTPTSLEILQELEKRKALFEELENERLRLETGSQGEQKVLSYLQQFGSEHWQLLSNLWLDHFGKFECDLLLLTSAGIHPFEIKNYTGQFEFRKSQCLINGKKVGHNAIAQAQKVSVNIKNILNHAGISANLQGAAIFIGPHNEVIIHDSIEDIDIVQANQLRNYIWKIVQEERNYRGKPIDAQKILKVLKAYETENPFDQDRIPDKIKSCAHKGILCSRCGNFNLDTNRSYISCPCGMHEPREKAIVRTICEYGVIHHDKELTVTELDEFFDGEISKQTLRKYLNIHFTRIGTGKGTKYVNLRFPFKKAQQQFDLNRPCYLEL